MKDVTEMEKYSEQGGFCSSRGGGRKGRFAMINHPCKPLKQSNAKEVGDGQHLARRTTGGEKVPFQYPGGKTWSWQQSGSSANHLQLRGAESV